MNTQFKVTGYESDYNKAYKIYSKLLIDSGRTLAYCWYHNIINAIDEAREYLLNQSRGLFVEVERTLKYNQPTQFKFDDRHFEIKEIVKPEGFSEIKSVQLSFKYANGDYMVTSRNLDENGCLNITDLVNDINKGHS